MGMNTHALELEVKQHLETLISNVDGVEFVVTEGEGEEIDAMTVNLDYDGTEPTLKKLPDRESAAGHPPDPYDLSHEFIITLNMPRANTSEESYRGFDEARAALLTLPGVMYAANQNRTYEWTAFPPDEYGGREDRPVRSASHTLTITESNQHLTQTGGGKRWR